MSSFRPDARVRRLPRPAEGFLLLLVAAWGPGGAVAAQERAVVSNEITVSSSEARLRLEFLDGGRLEITFEDSDVRVDGEVVGNFQRGDALDSAWRELLGRAVSLENGPLVRALIEWSPPSDLPESEADVAARVDGALAVGLQTGTAADAPTPVGAGGAGLEELLSRPELLPLLGEALRGIAGGEPDVRFGGGPLVIASGETREGPLVVVDGEVEVRGTLEGDLVVVRGSLRMVEGGEITGDVRLADSRLFRDGGRIGGEVTTVEATGAITDRERLREELRNEIRDELRRELRPSAATPSRQSRTSPFRNLSRGISGLVENAMAVLILSGLGWVLIHFAGPRVGTVAEAARANPARAGAVGIAAAFLVLPVWILGMLGLVISLVGILALPFWILLFPLGVAGAALLGGVAVATLLGEWVTSRRIQGLERLRPSNPFHTVLAGVTLLTLCFMAANVLQMAGPLTGVLRGLVTALGVLGFLSATAVGLGAVLLTRGGARAPGTPWTTGDDWADDDLFGGTGRRSRWQARWNAERERWRRDAPDSDAEEPDGESPREPRTDDPRGNPDP